MSRNRSEETKSLLHVCNNNNKSDLNDKWFKLLPLIYVVNKKLIQFRIFSHYLSTDEQMIPYFGRHLCKMLIHSKPIRSGYKNWVLCGHNGYPYQVHSYQGHENYPKVGALGTRVVNSLCNVIENMENHEVCFDNLFTSIPPLEFKWLQLDLNPEPLSS